MARTGCPWWLMALVLAGCGSETTTSVSDCPSVVFSESELQRVSGLLAEAETGPLGISYAEVAEMLRGLSEPRPVDYTGFPTEEPADFWDQKAHAVRLELDVKHAGMLLHVFDDDRHVAPVMAGILKAARWSRWSERDLPSADILRALAFGYDWFHERWTLEERELLRDAMVEKGIQRILDYAACADSKRSPMCDGASPNHMASNAAALGFAALVLADEPDSRAWLDLAVERMEHSLEAAGGPDGGAVEGLGYGNVEGIFAMDFLQELTVSRGVDLAGRSGWLRNYPVYVACTFGPGGQYVNFNDSELTVNSTASVLLWLASMFPDTREGGIAQALARDLYAEGAYLGPLGLFHLDLRVEPRERDTLELVQAYPSVGQVVVRTGWQDDDLLFASRSQGPGTDGNMAHTHFDSGHFVLNYGGDHLLADPGYAIQSFLIGQVPDPGAGCPGVEFGYLNEFTLRASGHNTVVFDNAVTQMNLVDGLVRTDAPDPGIPVFFVEMEFGDAYRRVDDPGTRLFDFVRRRIVGVLPHAVLVHDHARSVSGSSSHTMQVLFHSRWKDKAALGPQPDIRLNAEGALVRPVDGSHVLRIVPLGDPPATLSVVEHPFVTCAGEFLAGESGPANELRAAHLLVPSRDSDDPVVEDLSANGYVGARVTVGADSATVFLSASNQPVEFPGPGTGTAAMRWNLGGSEGEHLVQ